MSELERRIKQERYLWIRGRFGGGKTSLALWLANSFIEQGFCRRVVCNTPLAIDVPLTVTSAEKWVTGAYNAVLILDEAGQFLDWGSGVNGMKKWLSFLRKRNQIVLMPSVMPVVKFATKMVCQRIVNGSQLGLNFWLYRWKLDQYGEKDAGFYTWWNPGRIFGLYDTDHEPTDDWYIYDFEDAFNKDGRGWVDEDKAGQSSIELGEHLRMGANGIARRATRSRYIVR